MMNRWLEKNQQLTLNRRMKRYNMAMPWKKQHHPEGGNRRLLSKTIVLGGGGGWKSH
jgi:hypothetical protein